MIAIEVVATAQAGNGRAAVVFGVVVGVRAALRRRGGRSGDGRVLRRAQEARTERSGVPRRLVAAQTFVDFGQFRTAALISVLARIP